MESGKQEHNLGAIFNLIPWRAVEHELYHRLLYSMTMSLTAGCSCYGEGLHYLSGEVMLIWSRAVFQVREQLWAISKQVTVVVGWVYWLGKMGSWQDTNNIYDTLSLYHSVVFHMKFIPFKNRFFTVWLASKVVFRSQLISVAKSFSSRSLHVWWIKRCRWRTWPSHSFSPWGWYQSLPFHMVCHNFLCYLGNFRDIC